MKLISRTPKEQSTPHLSSTPQVWKHGPAISKPRAKSFPTRVVTAALAFALCLPISCSKFDSNLELQKAEARFVPVAYRLTSTSKRADLQITALVFDVPSNSQIFTEPDPDDLKSVQEAVAILEKVPCSLPGFSTWKEYVLGQVAEIRLYRPFMGGDSAGSVDLDSPQKAGDFIFFRNAAGNAVVILNPESIAHIPTTMVHEATHLYPLPLPRDSLDLSLAQALELTASAIELRFFDDYCHYLDTLPATVRNSMPDFSDLPRIKFDEHLPLIMANTYGKSKFRDVPMSSFFLSE